MRLQQGSRCLIENTINVWAESQTCICGNEIMAVQSLQKSTVGSIIRGHHIYKEVWWQVVGE